MDQFVLVPASVYNSLVSKPVLKQELPKYQVQQTPTSHVESLKKDVNKKLFAKADSLIDNLLASPRISLSNSNTLLLDGKDTSVLLKDFARHLRLKNPDVPDIYFTLLDAAQISPSLVINQNAKAKDRGNCIPFKI